MPVTVRAATIDDMPSYMDLAEAFVATTPVSHIVPFDREGTAAFVEGALDSENMIVLVAEDAGELIGITAAIAYPMYFNPSKLVAQELWWYIKPDARGGAASKLLFQEIEKWGKSKQAEAMFMVALDNDRVTTMAKMYGRLGYAPTERVFVKGLN
jgi:GNAT superfamily N-acetyltransferase